METLNKRYVLLLAAVALLVIVYGIYYQVNKSKVPVSGTPEIGASTRETVGPSLVARSSSIITVSSPSDGQSFPAGQNIKILWNGAEGSDVGLTLADLSGRSMGPLGLISVSVPNTGSYIWKVDQFRLGKDFRVMVSDSKNEGVSGTFSILPPAGSTDLIPRISSIDTPVYHYDSEVWGQFYTITVHGENFVTSSFVYLFKDGSVQSFGRLPDSVSPDGTTLVIRYGGGSGPDVPSLVHGVTITIEIANGTYQESNTASFVIPPTPAVVPSGRG